MFYARGDSRDSTSSGLGLPSNSNTFSIWFNVEVPGKMALPIASSPTIHPITFY